jgi:4-methylaminobutanoate oxidase (formaldehyde-forming)
LSANFPDQARVVIIGGGAIGCATAYHLAKHGCTDVVILERHKLTSGSTWHAAGAYAQFRTDPNAGRMMAYGGELYAALEAETGQATGWHRTGGMRVACNPERRREYERAITIARSFGVEMELLTPKEAGALIPIMTTDKMDCALYIPSDGAFSPTDLCMALAKGARMHGARIFEDTLVTGFDIHQGAVRAVETSHGKINCETAVICCGIWSREIGLLAGVNIPVQPSHHCYFITEPIEGVTRDMPTFRDPDKWHYIREEVGGLIVGQYDPDPIPYIGNIPEGHEFKLMPENLDHFMPRLEGVMEWIPALQTAGIKTWMHGLEAFTEDQNPVMGEAPEVRNLFVSAGFNAYGVTGAGGAGMVIGEWILNGEPPYDVWSFDIRRFGAYHRSDNQVLARSLEGQGHHYTIIWPYEEMTAGRPLRRSAIYGALQAKRACFGAKSGWERPNWFAPAGVEPVEINSFARPNWHEHVGAEHAACRNSAALFDQSSFAKFSLIGRDAEVVLGRLCAGDVAVPPGRTVYTQMLNRQGGIECDLTVTRITEDQYYIVTGTGFATHDFDHIKRHIPGDAHASLVDVTSAYGVLSLMGPNARKILEAVAEGDVGAEAFPFMAAREIHIGGAPVRALRLTYVGELGWELHVPTEYMLTVYEALAAADAAFGLVDAGYRAIDSLRLEKGYRAWAGDIGADFTPLEAGLGFAVAFDKESDFIGRDALLRQRDEPLVKRLVTITTADDPELLLTGRETIIRDGERVGWLSSGGYGHTIGRHIGLGYIRRGEGVTNDYLRAGSYRLEAANRQVEAELHLRPLYDPDSSRVKS